MLTFLRRLIQNLADCFAIKNLPYHLVAFALTLAGVLSGFDWWWFTHTRGNLTQLALFPAVVVGGMVPLVLPVLLLLVGGARVILKGSRQLFTTGLAVLQAQILAGFISAFYKSITGRIQPPLHALNMGADNSGAFNFGFWEHGIFWGWPSTHTTLAFAAAVTLACLYPKNKGLVGACLLYAFYIGFGISTNIHWFTDFAAGAIIGSVIGTVVAKSFKVDTSTRKV